MAEAKPQRAFSSWVEPESITIPLMLQCNVQMRRILDYDGTDTGMIEIIIPPAIQGTGSLRLPRAYFSDEINGKLAEIPKRRRWECDVVCENPTCTHADKGPHTHPSGTIDGAPVFRNG